MPANIALPQQAIRDCCAQLASKVSHLQVLVDELRCEATDAAHADKAAVSLWEAGWAVVRGALAPEPTAALRLAAQHAAAELLRLDPPRMGNRGPRRYSFGGSSRTHHMVHLEAWASLLDLPLLHDVLDRAFNGSYFAVGGGGDFVLGHTDTHQRLHVDLQHDQMYDFEVPPAAIVANFAVGDVSCTDGPMRLVPRTHLTPLALAEAASRGAGLDRASSLEREVEMQRRLGLSTTLACPLVAGDLLLRDMRIWHGGSPNLGPATRLLPSAEFLSPWYAALTEGTDDHFAPRPALPFVHWANMSARGRAVSRRILSAPAPVDAGVQVPFVLLLPYVAEDGP